ncbi:MAG: cytoplasmic protein [Betaproteobacteria bacterium RIFCSPLOWO2_02_FULL_62_17]|nr:MAG: cytoplasmic protein [Betaproteobacteria bacterium RIFCSPLOWO2_02_FULL_62_17]
MVIAVGHVHERCAIQAGKAVNITVTVRNWVIGCYIREYEQHGSDRAAYGAKLLDTLARRLASARVVGLASRTLRQCRLFYVTYPGIWQTLSAKSHSRPPLPGIWQTLSAELPMPTSITAHALTKQRAAPTPESSADPTRLVSHLSFSHFAELISIDDPLKRAFYEMEAMRGNWSVRELQRQIGALYFERSRLSKNPAKLSALVQASAEVAEPQFSIRDPYVFEFLGLKSQEVMGESDLENGLLDKLQAFLIELGHGFCFEARQKRILIGDTHGFIDLVFYHRILKCHVLIELKVAGFKHEHLGQLNTYVSWFKRNAMTTGDNPPIGLLLCTRKDHSLVEYALADLPNRLFVSKYQLELPTRDQLRKFLDAQLEEVGDA